MVPVWLTLLSWGSVVLGLASAAFIAADLKKNPQHMTIMNYVWPLCALFGHVLLIQRLTKEAM